MNDMNTPNRPEDVSTEKMRDEALWAASGTLANNIRSLADALNASRAECQENHSAIAKLSRSLGNPCVESEVSLADGIVEYAIKQLATATAEVERLGGKLKELQANIVNDALLNQFAYAIMGDEEWTSGEGPQQDAEEMLEEVEHIRQRAAQQTQRADQAEQRAKRLEEALAALLRSDQPYSLRSIIQYLRDTANILLDGKDYDGHGWEFLNSARHLVPEVEQHIRHAQQTLQALTAPPTAGTPAGGKGEG